LLDAVRCDEGGRNGVISTNKFNWKRDGKMENYTVYWESVMCFTFEKFLHFLIFKFFISQIYAMGESTNY
jgi:hypothetical protein